MIIAGDSIIDWIIKDGEVQATVGGAGNIVRGLEQLGHEVQFITLYNPMLYPMSYVFNLHPLSLTDFNHRNVFVRDYDKGIFHRFRENLRKNVIDVTSTVTAVICHEDSIIRRFNSFYADVRDTSVRGKTYILRMSSTDNTEEIMKKIDYEVAIITHKNKVEIQGLSEDEPERWDVIKFPEVQAVDDIGAGDAFNVGFLDFIERKAGYQGDLIDAIATGIETAQRKVREIGVFMDEKGGFRRI